MKRKIIIFILAVFIISAIGISSFLIYDNNRAVSTLLLDINPSIKITLNKRDKVLNAVPLNDDAKKIVSDDLKGKKLENVIEVITDKIVEEGFTLDNEVVILVNATGKIESSNVVKILENKFENKEIECSVLIQKTDNEAVKNAKEYNISESKAAFIKEIIDNNENLNFEDLKGKSISELEKIKETPKEDNNVSEPVKEEEPTVETPATEKPVTPPQTTKPSSSNPSSDPTDTSGVWCTWNANRKAGSTYYYDKQINQETVHQQILAHLGLTALWSTIGDSSGAGTEPRSSYCIGYFFKITTVDTIYNIIADSVTGNIIEEKTSPTPKPKYTEEQALDIVLNYYKVSKDDCKLINNYYGTNFDNMPEYGYYYDISLDLIDGTRHYAKVNAETGIISHTRTEHY